MRARIGLVGAAAIAALCVSARVARAQTADGGDDLAAYEREIDAVLQKQRSGALEAEDCSTACRALGSMRRATERICSLDFGAACEDAKRRTAAAETKVNDACPSCAAPVARAADKPAMVGATPATESAPQHGGCASCATTSSAPGDALLYFGVVGAAFAWRRRRVRARRER